MPTFVVTAPDGKKYRVNAPEGATQDQAIRYIADTYYSARPQESQQEPETTIGGHVWEGLKGIPSGAIGLIETAAVGASSLLPEETEKAARESIASMAEAAQAPFTPNEGYEDSVARGLGEAVGSTVPFFFAGPLGLAGRVATGALAAGAGAGEARLRAEYEGATEDQIAASTGLGSVVGISELFSPLRFFKRLPEDVVGREVGRIRRILTTAGEEAAQEAAAQFAQNAIAKGIYKPDQSLIEGLGEEAAYGGAAGAITATLFELATGRRSISDPDEEETRRVRERAGTEETGPQPPAAPPATPPGAPASQQSEAARLLSAIGGTDISRAARASVDEVPMGQPQVRQGAAEAEARRLAEAKRLAEQQAAEAEARRLAEAKRLAEQQAAEAEAKRLAEQQAAEAEARRLAEQQAAEAEAKRLAEQQAAEAEAKRLAEQQAAEAEAKRLAEQQAAEEAEARRLAEQLAKQQAEQQAADEAARQLAEQQAAEAEAKRLAEEKANETILEELSAREAALEDRLEFASPEERAGLGDELKTPTVQEAEISTAKRAEEAFVNRVVDVIRSTGQTSAIAIQKGLGIKLSEAKPIRDALIQNGILVKKGRSYVLKEELSGQPTGRTDAERDTRGVPELVREEETAKPETTEPVTGAVVPAGSDATVSDAREGGGEPALTEPAVTEEISAEPTTPITTTTPAEPVTPTAPTGTVDRLALIQQAVERRRQRAAEEAELAALVSEQEVDAAETSTPITPTPTTPVSPAPPAPTRTAIKDKQEARNLLNAAFESDQISEENYEAGMELLKKPAPRYETIQQILDNTYKPKRSKDIGLKFREGEQAPRERLPLQTVTAEIQAATEGWTNRPNMNVVESVNDLPEGLRARVPSTSKGFYDPETGTVHILAENAQSDSDVRATVYHESLGHYGLAQEFQDGLDNILSDIYRTNDNVRAETDKFLEDNKDAYSGLEDNERNLRAVEEVLVRRAEAGPIKEPGLRTAFNRLAAYIRNIGRKIGLVSTYTDNDVAQVMRRASDRVTRKASVSTPTTDKTIRLRDPDQDVVQRRRDAINNATKKGVFRDIIDAAKRSGYEGIVKSLQNSRRQVLMLQRGLERTGKLIITGNKKNNVYDAMSRAPNLMANIISTVVEPAGKKVYQAVGDYAAAKKITVEEALAQLDSYLIALHEPERRRKKFADKVKLDNITEYMFGNVRATPDQMRGIISDAIRRASTVSEAKRLGEMLYQLAETDSFRDPSAKPITDAMYNVVGSEYTDQALARLRREAENPNNPFKPQIDKVREEIKRMHEVNISLNKKANYWTDQTDMLVASYGWENYVPFRGMPNSESELDYSARYISGELAEVQDSFEGRKSEFDSPILESITEGYPAASRVARNDVMVTLRNLIDQKLLKVKKAKPEDRRISFAERTNKNFDTNKIKGSDKILFYNPDGSIDVYKIANRDQIEAIKGTFQKMNPIMEFASKFTNFLGQTHTRYNVAFPPMDFVRNSITNAVNIALAGSPSDAAEYAWLVTKNVLKNGIGRSWGISQAFASGDLSKINQLRNKSQFHADVIELVSRGGKTTYRDVFDVGQKLNELKEYVGKDGMISTSPNSIIPPGLTRLFDAWNDSFELTSRVAAYRVRLDQNIQKAIQRGETITPEIENDLKNEAAAFALELMNFRQVGDYGRNIGTFYMFWRPSVTSAVKALDGLMPAFRSLEDDIASLPPQIREIINPKPRGNNESFEDYQRRMQESRTARSKYERDFNTRRDNALSVTTALFLAGIAAYAMSRAMSGEDEEGRNKVSIDDKSRWTRFWRIPTPWKDTPYIQLPWGFGASAFMAAGSQVAALTSGDQDNKKFFGNMVEISLDSFLPIPASRINPLEHPAMWFIDSASPSMARPFIQSVANLDSFGSPIENERTGKYASSFTKSTRASEWAVKASKTMYNISADIMPIFGKGPIEINPSSLDFWLNNYFDAPSHVVENAYNLYLVSRGDKKFDPKTDAFVLRSFVGTASNYDAEQYAKASKKVESVNRTIQTFLQQGDLERLDRYLDENPNALIVKDMYDKIDNGALRALREQRNNIARDPDITPKERKELLDDLRLNENFLKRAVIGVYEDYM